jgi:hypothetical protein
MCYDLNSGKFLKIKEGVRFFDVSDKFLVTCNPVFGYVKSGNLEQPYFLSGFIAVYDRNNHCIYEENIQLKFEFTHIGILFPIISPDEKKIVIFRCFDNLKPIVIETSKLRKVK